MSVWGEARVQVEEEHGYADERRVAPEALFALLGLGLLGAAAASPKRRKTLTLLALLVALAFFLWRRALDAAEPVPAVTEERETEAFTEPAASEPAATEPVEADAVEDIAVADEAVPEEAATEEAVEEAPVAAEPEVAEAEAEDPFEFEALDAALAALIGELERVEATQVELEEVQRAWREAQAEEAQEHAKEHSESEAERELVEEHEHEHEEQATLVHAGRQLVHAGGYDSFGPGVQEEGLHLPEGDDGELEPPADQAEAESEAVPERVEVEAVLPEPVPVAEPVAPVAAPQPAPAAETPARGGLVGLIGRYSHHRETPDPAPDAPQP